MEHQHHLVSMSSLQLVDSLLKKFAGRSWKYYSSLAIFTNVARSIAKKLYLEWSSHYGAKSALESVRKLFPRCCSTRWGSIDGTESRMLQAGCDRLCVVMSQVLSGANNKANKPNKSSEPPATAATAPSDTCAAPKEKEENDLNLNPDTLAVEAVREYQLRMGKWRRHALTVLGDPLFEPVISTMHDARSPLTHLSNFLKSRLTQSVVRKQGNHLTQLSCGKAMEMFAEFEDILCHLVACSVACVTLPLYSQYIYIYCTSDLLTRMQLHAPVCQRAMLPTYGFCFCICQSEFVRHIQIQAPISILFESKP